MRWVPIVTAVSSILLSTYTLVTARYEPDVRVLMPKQVRMAQGGSRGAYLYVRPVFIAAGPSERVEVITDVYLQVEPRDRGRQGAQFVWDEQGIWRYDPATQELTWTYTDDAGPFLVYAGDAELFTGLFVGPREWRFEAGGYRITLVAERAVSARPLTGSFEVEFSEESIQLLNESGGTRFLTFPAR
jgi:hypothetical protein